MIKKVFLPLALVFCFTPISECRLFAQPEYREYIIAGDFLDRLWDWIDAKNLKITNVALKSHVLDRHLAAILLPKDQTPSNYHVRLCFKTKSFFDVPDFTIPKADYEELVSYAESRVYGATAELLERFHQGDSSSIAAASARLQRELAAVPAADRATSELFAGALLAEADPVAFPALKKYVDEYRKSVEHKTLQALELPGVQQKLQSGQAYSVGSRPLSELDLAKIDPSKVDKIEVAGKTYRKAWLGANLVLALQAPSETEPLFRPKDPTGLGLITKPADVASPAIEVKEVLTNVLWFG